MVQKDGEMMVVRWLFMWMSFALYAERADVQVYFVPHDSAEIARTIEHYFTYVQRQILIASYWITDQPFIERLITLKQKGIDVHVIYDGSMFGHRALMKQLIEHNIIPVVSPYGTNHKMHNKCMVVDNRDVLTGSANFTSLSLRPAGERYNDENVVVMQSPLITQRYRENFFKIESVIFKTYIKMLANSPRKQIEEWVKELVLELYRKNSRFKQLLLAAFAACTHVQRERLKVCFPGLRRL